MVGGILRLMLEVAAKCRVVDLLIESPHHLHHLIMQVNVLVKSDTDALSMGYLVPIVEKLLVNLLLFRREGRVIETQEQNDILNDIRIEIRPGAFPICRSLAYNSWWP